MRQSSLKLISMPHNQLYDSHVKHGYPLWIAKHMFNFNPPKTSYTAQKWREKKREKKSKKEKTCTNSQKPDREGWGKGGGRSDGEGGVWALCVHEEAGKTAAVRTKSHPALDKPLEFHGELGEVSETTTREPKTKQKNIQGSRLQG